MLKTKSQLDRERIDHYSLVIVAKDHGNPALQSSETVEIQIGDVNDNAPFFHQSQYLVSVDENNKINEQITTLEARDLDSGENGKLRYVLSQPSQNFAINEETGVVYALRSLDAEKFTEPEILEIIAQDGGDPPKTGRTTLRISIKDFNDNIPVFVKKSYRFEINENVPIDLKIGKVTAIDGDLNPTVKYHWKNTGKYRNSPFEIDEETGEIFVARSVDFETDGKEFNLFAVATDQDGQWDQTAVTIIVKDLNDNQPVVSYPLPNRDVVWVNPKLRTGQLVAKIKATDADNGKNGKILISLDSEKIDFVNVNSAGEILLQRDLVDNDFGRHSITVRVEDMGTPVSSTILRVSF